MKQLKRIRLTVFAIMLTALLFFSPSVYATTSDDGWDDEWGDGSRPYRVEPEGEGAVYEVCFMWEKGVLYEPMAVLEGEGLGQRQWLEEWHRTNYTFMGWYDNVEGTGERYTMNTPIFHDTYLHALWQYSGPGGPWPRPTPGVISGLDINENLQPGDTVTITAAGHNTHLVDPPSERFRWIPASWRVNGLGEGQFSGGTPYAATISLATAGSYTLSITYREEVFDSITWQDTGKTHEVVELPFSVGFEYAATNTQQSDSARRRPDSTTEIAAEQSNSTMDSQQVPAGDSTALEKVATEMHDRNNGWVIAIAIATIIFPGGIIIVYVGRLHNLGSHDMDEN